LNAWKKLLESSEEVARELLPTCVRCGECCRLSSPTLQKDDLELVVGQKIPWNQLMTLRRGEAVRSPFERMPIFLDEDRIKIREKEGSHECVFFDAENEACGIYDNRPVQCRAQACWDPKLAEALAKKPFITRWDILKGVDLLLELIDEHDRRCSFHRLNEAFTKLEETKGESVNEVLDLMAYEDHFRRFLGDKLNIPADTLDLIFGRSYADLAALFGFKVVVDEDGSRCLVLDR
ncbi:MAG: YkgJ family cysteine cluster protein, partial [Acidobacteriota bacterium]